MNATAYGGLQQTRPAGHRWKKNRTNFFCIKNLTATDTLYNNNWRVTESGARACRPVTERILMSMMRRRRLPDAVCRSRAPLYCYILFTLLSQ
jgi:hypothetical protein